MRAQNFLRLIVLIPIFFISACEVDDEFTGTLIAPFRVTGTANATGADGTKVDCSFDFVFDVTATETTNEFEGVYHGVVARSVEMTDGKGFSYSANVNASAEARLIKPNTARIEVPTNGIGSNSRFLKGLSEFVATMDQQGIGAGTWVCAPLDTTINGFNDNVISINGNFTVQPISGN